MMFEKIAIIGAGVMGEAMIAGLLRTGLVHPEHIIAAEPRPERRDELRTRYGIRVTEHNHEALPEAQVVILAIKPQLVAQVLSPLHGCIPSDALVLSILAGVPMEAIANHLGHAAVVRAMPNTPAQIGAGMSVWTCPEDVSPLQREWARAILGALGEELFVATEHELDMATALNGSGPAYVFLILEAMVDAGVHLGFARAVAERLVLHTVAGSVRYALASGQHLAHLRNSVTSPAGTTAAALSVLERGRLRATISDAIWAAYRRSQELGLLAKQSAQPPNRQPEHPGP